MRGPQRLLVAIAGIALMSAGCATVGHRPLDPENHQHDQNDIGVRYYRSSPYLIAHSDGKGGVITEVKFLPDLTKLMSAQPKTTLADVDTTMSFENGVLTSASTTADATAVTKAITKAVEGLGTTFLSALANEKAKEPNTYKVPPPVLYKIVVEGSRVYLLQAKADGDAAKPIEITLLPEKAK